MGRRNRGHRFNRNKAKDNNNSNKNHQTAGSYDKIIKENKLFEKYYRETGIVPENEWNEFIDCLKEPLPVTFRITSYKNYSNEILNILKEKHFKLINEYFVAQQQQQNDDGNDDQNITPKTKLDEYYKCLQWYPNELAWQVNLSRQDVRKNEKFQKFKQFLIDQTESGNISRQEAVSMIPPLVLDAKPHHKILDMCAAPGSKTAQLIEFLHSDVNNPTPEGFVVANDIDNKRCYMLVHQLKRLESPNFMIINHDSSVLPNIQYETTDGQLRSIFYDRILCDVPCSGDGTFRKNVDIWLKWNSAHACNLHGIQSRIAQRAFELLAPNGLMVYSTCSLNPVENEAVIYNLLLKYKGQIELVDGRQYLPGLKTVPGFYSWKIMSKDGELYDKIEQVNEKWKYLIREYMFPPSLEVAQELKLEKCIRVLPHHQNTGGFFIALLKKISINDNYIKPPEASEEEVVSGVQDNFEEATNDSNTNDSNPPDPSGRGMKSAPAKRLKHVYDENPFRFCADENQLEGWPILEDFFGVSKTFPLEQLMMRNRKGENVKNVYFVSKNIHDIVQLNVNRIKFINMGVRLFSKAELRDRENVELKICQEGIDIVQKYFTKRTLHINERDDFLKLLSDSMPDINKFSDDLQNQVKECSGVGSIIMLCHDKNTKYTRSDAGRFSPISFTGWLGKTTIRPFLNIQSRKFLLTLCDKEDEEIEKICESIRLQDQINTEKSQKTEKKTDVKMT